MVFLVYSAPVLYTHRLMFPRFVSVHFTLNPYLLSSLSPSPLHSTTPTSRSPGSPTTLLTPSPVSTRDLFLPHLFSLAHTPLPSTRNPPHLRSHVVPSRIFWRIHSRVGVSVGSARVSSPRFYSEIPLDDPGVCGPLGTSVHQSLPGNYPRE